MKDSINIFENLVKKININDYKELGYNSKSKFLKKYNKFITFKSLKDLLIYPDYDLNSTNQDFLNRIIKFYNQDNKIIEEYNKLEIIYKKQEKRFKNFYIKAITPNFKRKNEPIIALGILSSKRIVQLEINNYVFYEKEEIFKILIEKSKKHYKKLEGKILIFGEIKNYEFFFNNKTYVIDINNWEIKEK